MKGLSAGLTFVSLSTAFAVVLGILGSGLSPVSAALSLSLGCILAAAAYLDTCDDSNQPAPITEEATAPAPRYRSAFLWIVGAIFAIFAFRSFCWLFYIDGDEFKIQSPNNLGDLALHITYIKDFANGSPLWPANPIFPIGKLRYPAGPDLFNGLLCLVNVDLIRGLVWTGLLASAATFYALYRWGRTFAVAGFLFNGGIVGFQFLDALNFADYQGDKTIAWKSIPLSMFVTQRGLLYAIPAGLLLLWHWRKKYSADSTERRSPLPFWVELSLYASMPLFHMHTFLALTVVLIVLFVCGAPRMRGHVVILVASALLPATFFVWLITDHFLAGSVVKWSPGWVQSAGDFKRSSFLLFWWYNFGIWMPLAAGLVGLSAWRAWQNGLQLGRKMPVELAFLIAATAIFTLGLLFKFAPWEWDNLKLMVWGYFIILPLLWTQFIAKWSLPVRVGVCIALFGSGFVSLFGGLAAGRPGFGFANRGEIDSIAVATRNLPIDARFAAFPTFNHPVLLQGRNAVLGYPGHLWTQGFDYGNVMESLTNVMQGKGDWRRTAHSLGARYLFWGREEKANYATSTRPWERIMKPIAEGTWGAIYDLEPEAGAAKMR